MNSQACVIALCSPGGTTAFSRGDPSPGPPLEIPPIWGRTFPPRPPRAAQQRRGRGGRPLQLRHHCILPGELAEEPRAHETSSLTAGMSPVEASATEGTGSGSKLRIRSWMSVVISSCGRFASSTR